MSINSAVVIARLLGTEGFTDFVGNQIEKYWRTRSGLTDRQQRQITKLDQAISAIANKLEVKERLALGRFIGLHKKMSFDTGLRIGLTTFQMKCARGREDDCSQSERRRPSKPNNEGSSPSGHSTDHEQVTCSGQMDPVDPIS